MQLVPHGGDLNWALFTWLGGPGVAPRHSLSSGKLQPDDKTGFVPSGGFLGATKRRHTIASMSHCDQLTIAGARPCSAYIVDVRGRSYGDCKCGFGKKDHTYQGQSSIARAAAAAPDLPRPSDLKRTASEGPCSSYKVDVVGANFGDCVCGLPKKSHEIHQLIKASLT